MSNILENTPISMAQHYTNGAYIRSPHLELLNSYLCKIHHKKIKRLLVSMPPRHGKSELISRFFPAWYLCNNPSAKIILTSYNQSKAARFRSQDIYRYYKKDLLIERQDYYENYSQGRVLSAGAGGTLTGEGADLLIIDDPYKSSQEANSAYMREKIFEWFNSTAFTRLQPNGAVIIIHTRWHLDDLIGRLKDDSEWTYLNLPAIAGENDLIGRKVGEPLFPEFYDIEALEAIKKQIGTYWFAAEYQQNPVLSENQIIQSEWIKYYNVLPSGIYYQSWDTAFESGEQNDYSVCTTWLVNNKNRYLVDVLREKLTTPRLIEKARELYQKYRPTEVLIENKGSGISLKQYLMNEKIPVRPINVISDKVLRLNSVTPIFERGEVYFPSNLDKNLIDELLNFPYEKHDDFVDSLSQFLEYSKKFDAMSILLQRKPSYYKSNYYEV